MGALTEQGLNELVAAGCGACGSTSLVFRTYVDGRLPLIGGEPVGPITWIYDGEKFVDGVFEATCAACKHVLFTSDACPRCNAPATLAAVLAAPNRHPPPTACPTCHDEDLHYLALIPARVTWETNRASKARATADLQDPGFHATRVDCATCGIISEVTHCPLCTAPPPLRPRP